MAIQNNISSLNAEICTMISLLEKHDVESSGEFFTRYAVPEELAEKLKQENKIQEIIESFHNEKSGVLLRVLKTIQSDLPVAQNDGCTYTYPVMHQGQEVARISFVWSDATNKFYLQNH